MVRQVLVKAFIGAGSGKAELGDGVVSLLCPQIGLRKSIFCCHIVKIVLEDGLLQVLPCRFPEGRILAIGELYHIGNTLVPQFIKGNDVHAVELAGHIAFIVIFGADAVHIGSA